MVWETEVSTKVGVLLCTPRSPGQLRGAHVLLPISEAKVSVCPGAWVQRC